MTAQCAFAFGAEQPRRAQESPDRFSPDRFGLASFDGQIVSAASAEVGLEEDIFHWLGRGGKVTLSHWWDYVNYLTRVAAAGNSKDFRGFSRQTIDFHYSCS
jgi:hypothetical protein